VEGRVVGPSWEHLKPKGPKGEEILGCLVSPSEHSHWRAGILKTVKSRTLLKNGLVHTYRGSSLIRNGDSETRYCSTRDTALIRNTLHQKQGVFEMRVSS